MGEEEVGGIIKINLCTLDDIRSNLIDRNSEELYILSETTIGKFLKKAWKKIAKYKLGTHQSRHMFRKFFPDPPRNGPKLLAKRGISN